MDPSLRQRLCALRICAHTLVFLSVLTGVVQGQSHWEVRPSNINSPLHAVTFGNGLFVAVGENGAIVTSPEGNVWTPRVSGTTDRLPAVVFGNGRFVATRSNRNAPAISSEDGVNWTPVTVTNANGTPAATSAFSTIAFGGGRFLAAGTGPSGSTEVIRSDDGIAFQTITPVGLVGTIGSLTSFRGKFYGFTGYAGFYASADGVSWSDPPGWGDFFYTETGVTANDQISKVAIVGSANPGFSEDAGHTFQQSERPLDRYQPESPGGGFVPIFSAACYGAATFVAVDTKGGVWTSSRGEYWRPQGYYGVGGQEFRSVASDGISRFVAVGGWPSAGAALIATAAADSRPPPPTYRIRSLITQAGVVLSEVRSINNAGAVAGAVGDYAFVGNTVAAIVRDGHATIWSSPAYRSYANGVSDSGAAAVEIASPPITGLALLPSGEVIYPFSNTRTSAGGINAQGVIAGSYGAQSPSFGIYRYDTTTRQLTDLGNFGMQSITAEAINDLNDLAGIGNGLPFRLSASGVMETFPNLGGDLAYVTAINATGDFVGGANMPIRPWSALEAHAALWRDGAANDVDTLNTSTSFAFGINSRGDVVGYFLPPQADPSHAFLYTDGAMHDLNALLDASGDGWILTSASGINDSQQIAGMGLHNGRPEPFLAEPVAGPPAGTQTRFVNVSTRLKAGAGDNVLIGGFILQGGAKRIVVRALGPALGSSLPNLMEDPTLELVDGAGQRIAFNDNYDDLPFAERQEIQRWHLDPPPPFTGTQRNSVLIATLAAGNYTAVVRGNNGGTGNCLVEVYNVDADYTEALVNISTRGPVEGGDNVMIGGLIIRGDREQRVIVRAIGPSLAGSGVPDALADTTLEIFGQDGLVAVNDDWRSQQEAEIISSGLPPGDDRESAVIVSLWPGSYTAIVRGKNNTSGNALVEAYQLP